MNRKLILTISVIVLAAILLVTSLNSGSSASKDLSSMREKPFLIVAEDWPPFEYLEDDTLMGIDVELIEMVSSRINLSYEIKLYPWSRAWKMAQEGDADAVLSISYKSEREPYLHYSPEQIAAVNKKETPKDYLWMSEYIFFSRSAYADTIDISSYDNIRERGYIMGLIRGNSYFPGFLEAGFENKTYPTAKESMQALAKGEIDLYAMDKTIGLALIKQLGVSDKVVPLNKTLHSKPYFITPTKNSKNPDAIAIVENINSEIRTLRESGEYKKIYDKYTGEI